MNNMQSLSIRTKMRDRSWRHLAIRCGFHFLHLENKKRIKTRNTTSRYTLTASDLPPDELLSRGEGDLDADLEREGDLPAL